MGRGARRQVRASAQPTFPYEYRGRIKIAAQVQGFTATDYLDRKTLAFCDPVSQYLLVAADEAMAQAGFARDTKLGTRAATIIGTGIGGMTTIEEGIYLSLVKGGRPHALMVPKLIPSACPAVLAIRYGLQGPSFAVASACSLGDAGDRHRHADDPRRHVSTSPSPAAPRIASPTTRCSPGRRCA